MIEAPLMQELFQEMFGERVQQATAERVQQAMAERMQQAVLRVLSKRFGPVPQETRAAVQAIQDGGKLEELLDTAVDCSDLDAFSKSLVSSS